MKLCRKCGHRLTTKDVTPGYKYYCPNCDEDMFGIEAVDVPVVVVKDYGDGRVGTRAHRRLVRTARGRWGVETEFYNPVAGAMERCRIAWFKWKVRTRKAAEAAARPALKTKGWNWWYCSPERVRAGARAAGFIARIVKERKNG